MLTRVDNSNIETAEKILNAHPEFNVRVSGLLKAYGIGRPFFNLWIQGEKSVLARFEDNFFIYDSTDYEETAFFIQFNPYSRRVIGLADSVKKISEYINYSSGCSKYDCLVLNSDDKLGLTASGVERLTDETPDLSDVYSVMKQAGFRLGKFMPWYADISHRIRHGCARAYLVKADEKPVSSCLVSAESSRAGLISGIATIPGYRLRGFASLVIRQSCRKLLEEDKRPVLECAAGLTGFYEKFGFEKCGEMTELTII